MGIKIGFTNINYKCRATIDGVFKAWADIKQNPSLAPNIDKLFISSSHICFPETARLGFPVLSSDGTVERLKELNSQGIIDCLQVFPYSVEEQHGWTMNLANLPKDIDYLWMLGSDEHWTVKEIIETVDFLSANPEQSIFKVQFKNHIGNGRYVEDFIVPRIWNMKSCLGVREFYKDDLVVFNNGLYDTQVSSVVVPKDIAFPCHWSWSLPPTETSEENKQFCERKISFQKIRYGLCSYVWSEDSNRLELNEGYYNTYGLKRPEIKNS